jgi:hypothetical protein
MRLIDIIGGPEDEHLSGESNKKLINTLLSIFNDKIS